jgi:MOSC domain-containing protein YiiM
MSGHIFQINASSGGVPKHPLREADVTALGLSVDKVANPDIHGGPRAALCLFSLERIVALQAEGHPIFPGSVGENVTLAGLDWDQLKPGTRLRLGDGVLLEITQYTTPCQTIAESFSDRNSNRIHQQKHAGWSRVYASVLQSGHIQIGARAVVEDQ